MPARVYGGVSARERRDARRERLLDAGLELIGTRGRAATTVRGVCDAAGLTSRYFYESFAGLDELAVAIFDRIVAQAAETVLAAIAIPSDDALVMARAAIGAGADLIAADPRVARVLFVESQADEVLAGRRLEATRSFTTLVESQAASFYGTAPNSAPLVAMTASLLVGGFAEVLVRWVSGELEMTRDELVEHFSELFAATGETAAIIARRTP